jgi:hypothetical protein
MVLELVKKDANFYGARLHNCRPILSLLNPVHTFLTFWRCIFVKSRQIKWEITLVIIGMVYHFLLLRLCRIKWQDEFWLLMLCRSLSLRAGRSGNWIPVGAFPCPYRPAPRITRPPLQWVLDLSPGVKWPRPCADHLSLLALSLRMG